MINTVEIYFLLFIIYSFLGWILEIVDQLIEKRKLMNRGFLIGPYCPIYGIGCLFFILVLSRYIEHPEIVFFVAVVGCSTLEYLTSYLMEKIFHARWWDYTDKKFNLNGRICLEATLLFGILGTLILYKVNPFIIDKLNSIPPQVINITSIIVFLVFISDIILSLDIIFKFKTTMKTEEKDGTYEISKRVKEILVHKNWLFKRLVNAFPNFKNPKEIFFSSRNKR